MENNKKKKNIFVISLVCAARSRCLRRHRSCVNSLVRDDLESRTRGKKRASSGVAFILIKKRKRNVRLVGSFRHTEKWNVKIDACACIPKVFLYDPFSYFIVCLLIDCGAAANETKKELRYKRWRKEAALLKAFENCDKRGTKCAKVDCFLFQKRTLKHLFFYRLYNRIVSFFGGSKHGHAHAHTYRCVTTSKNNPLTIVGC